MLIGKYRVDIIVKADITWVRRDLANNQRGLAVPTENGSPQGDFDRTNPACGLLSFLPIPEGNGFPERTYYGKMVEYSKDKRRKAQFAMVHLKAKTQPELKQLLDELIQHIIPIFDKKLKRVILFGSYARGDYDAESDIDVMFLIDDEAKILSSKYRKPVRRIISDIDLKYGVLLCSVLQNEHDFYTCVNSIPFYQNVEKEGITLYG